METKELVNQAKRKLLGSRLRKMRTSRDLTQEYCARIMNCSIRAWSRWETGVAYPRGPYIEKIYELFPEAEL